MQLTNCTLRTENNHLIATFVVIPEDALEPLTATFIEHDDFGVHFFASGSCLKHGQEWEFEIALERSDRRRLLQLAKLIDTNGNSVSTGEFKLFLEPFNQTGDWETGPQAEARLAEINTSRETRYTKTLKPKGAGPADPVFSTVTLIENLLLTATTKLPGVQVMPINHSTLGSDSVDVLNAALTQLGFTSKVEPNAWLAEMRRKRPAAVVYIPRIQAPNAEAACEETRSAVFRLLDLMTLKRGAKPEILGGAIESRDATSGQVSFAGSWIETAGYTGNLLGGFISGEDPHTLFDHWGAIEQNPRLRLWLSLYADAVADSRWEYRLFRCFNLLEGIGKEELPSNAAVTDSKGDPILQPNNQPYTTSHARGKVYEITKKVALASNQSLQNFAHRANSSPGTLWDEVGIWVKVRNAVAHRGGWSLPDGTAPDNEHSATEQAIKDHGHDGSMESGTWMLVSNIRNATEATLLAGLKKLI
jgi:hypothetical protein